MSLLLLLRNSARPPTTGTAPAAVSLSGTAATTGTAPASVALSGTAATTGTAPANVSLSGVALTRTAVTGQIALNGDVGAIAGTVSAGTGIRAQNSGTWTGTSFTVSLGVTSSASNRVVLIVAGNTTVTTPAGFVLRDSQVNFMGHYLYDSPGGAASWSVTCSAGQGTWWVAEIAAGSYQTSGSQNLGSYDFSYATPGITPSTGARILIASIGSVTSNGLARTVSGWTNGFTEQADVSFVGADAAMQGVATLEVSASGATYSTEATFSASSTGRTGILASYVTTAGSPPAVTSGATGANAELTATAVTVLTGAGNAAVTIRVDGAATTRAQSTGVAGVSVLLAATSSQRVTTTGAVSVTVAMAGRGLMGTYWDGTTLRTGEIYYWSGTARSELKVTDLQVMT